MDVLMLFTDGSVNTHSHIGCGAYLAVPEGELSLDSLKTSVKVKAFEHTSSTKLELQTLLWALSDIQALGRRLIVYTDSQNRRVSRELSPEPIAQAAFLRPCI